MELTNINRLITQYELSLKVCNEENAEEDLDIKISGFNTEMGICSCMYGLGIEDASIIDEISVLPPRWGNTGFKWICPFSHFNNVEEVRKLLQVRLDFLNGLKKKYFPDES